MIPSTLRPLTGRREIWMPKVFCQHLLLTFILQPHHTSCFLPPSFCPFLLLLLLFLLGGWGTSRFLVPWGDYVTRGWHGCSAARPRGGRWATGSSTGIPAGKMRERPRVHNHLQDVALLQEASKQQLPHKAVLGSIMYRRRALMQGDLNKFQHTQKGWCMTGTCLKE